MNIVVSVIYILIAVYLLGLLVYYFIKRYKNKKQIEKDTKQALTEEEKKENE